MTIARNGTPVAPISPLPTPRLSAPALLKRWKNSPTINGDRLREDLDALIAATALARDFPLYTRDARHFEVVTESDVRAV